MRAVVLMVVIACAVPVCAEAQSSAVKHSLKGGFDMAESYVTRAAEQVPENLYSFKATNEVRSFGQLFAHIADVNHAVCSASSKENAPAGSVEKTAQTKSDIQKALTASFAFCDRAFEMVNDTTGGEPLKLFGAIDSTRLGALAFNTGHVMEIYGNVVTYMRLNKMVPPSSQGK